MQISEGKKRWVNQFLDNRVGEIEGEKELFQLNAQKRT